MIRHIKNLIRRIPWLGPALILAARRRRIRRLPPVTYVGNGRLLMQDWLGHTCFLDANDLLMTPWMVIHRTWEPHVMNQIVRAMRPGMNVIEVGAHIGLHTITLAQLAAPNGRVFAFEPNAASLELLRINLEVNGVADLVELVPSAVLDRSGEVEFQSFRGHTGGSCVGSEAVASELGDVDEARSCRVPATSLDEFLAGREVPIGLVKIDAEGSEPRVIAGMAGLIERNPDLVIICEFNANAIRNANKDPAEFLATIERLGFHIGRIGPRGIVHEMSIDALLAEGFCEMRLTRQ